MNTNKLKAAVLGGGNGSAIVLSGLKKYADRLALSAVISMSDSGGSTGRLRQEFNTLPPSDIMRAVVAMSRYDFTALRQIFYRNRFSGPGKLDGHNLGNLFVALVAQYAGDFMAAIRALEISLESVGRAYPVTLQVNDLAVELANGAVVKTDEVIDRPNYDRSLRIKRMWLQPAAAANPEAVRAIKAADYIILSPGSLYTSIIATLLPTGIKEAIAASRGKLWYVAGNAFQLNGETGPAKLSEAVAELEQYLPRPVDIVLYNNVKLNSAQQQRYADKQWGLLTLDAAALGNRPVIGKDFEKPAGGLSSDKLGKILLAMMR
ncbi:MAG: YvcK family protein [Candidatus Magasanikbacteria bacterium]|nr:YvcK family protein [Candidatus Magasanikbacteria bacterium]